MNTLPERVLPGEEVWNRDQVDYWSNLAGDYDSYYTSGWSQLENEWVAARLRFLEDHEAPVILDLGCGTGLGAKLASRWTSLDGYLGVDISAEMVGLTRVLSGVEAQVSAMDELHWIANGSVDVVLCLFSAASFVHDPQKFFLEISRVLKPGGVGYVSTLGRAIGRHPQKVSFKTRGDHSQRSVPAWRFRPKNLHDLVTAAGLTVNAIEGMNSLSALVEFPPLWRLGAALGVHIPATSHLLDVICSKEEEQV